MDRAASEHPRALTDEERETMQLLIMGLTDKEAAERLQVAHRTVGVRLARVMDKFGALTRMQAAAMFARTNGNDRS